MAIFKGELTAGDILYRLPYKLVNKLKDARIKQLEAENKAQEQMMRQQQSSDIRKNIMKP
nr:MAG TPA: hypothetical protein [Caudoviricetes sp.]